MPTIRDVAALAGVSTSTVSLAFSQSSRVSPQTARRIWNAAESLGYRPNLLAQSLKRGRSRMVAFLIGDVSSPFIGRLLKAAEKQALERGYLMVVSDTDGNPDRELELLDLLTAQRIAGILISPHGSGQDYKRRLASLDTPVVMVDHRLRDSEFDYVGSDTRLAATMLTDHLLNLGHRRIAQITGPTHLYTASERLEGYLQSLRAAGVEPDPSLIVNGKYRDVEGYTQAMKLLTRPDRPTAILAANNMMALGALQAIQELGLVCPKDVSLAMMDDVPWSSVIQPRLTMVTQDIDTIAQVATDYLIDRIEGDGKGEISHRETILAPRLSVGASTAACGRRGRVRAALRGGVSGGAD